MSRACNFFFFLSEPASFLYQIFLDQNLLVLSMASEFFLNIYLACLVKFLRTEYNILHGTQKLSHMR